MHAEPCPVTRVRAADRQRRGRVLEPTAAARVQDDVHRTAVRTGRRIAPRLAHREVWAPVTVEVADPGHGRAGQSVDVGCGPLRRLARGHAGKIERARERERCGERLRA